MQQNRQGIVLAVYAILLALPVLWFAPYFLSDDMFFYSQIAHNFVAGRGFSFDGYVQTNGFQPLWQGLTIALAFLIGNDKLLLVHAMGVLSIILGLVSVWLYWKLTKALELSIYVLGGSLIASFLLTTIIGGEGQLFAALFLTALLLVSATDGWSMGRGLAFGLVTGLALLSRLDTVFVIATLYYLLLIRLRGRQDLAASVRQCVVSGLVASAVVIPYLAWNLTTFGHLMPISGAVKSILPAIRPDLTNLGLVGMISALGALLVVLIRPCGLARHPFGRVSATIAIGTLLHAIYIVFATDHDTAWAWYYVPGLINLALLLSYLTDQLHETEALHRLTRWGLILATAGLFILTGVRVTSKVHPNLAVTVYGPPFIRRQENSHLEMQRISAELDQVLEPGVRIFIAGAPGRLAYYSRMAIFSSDELTANFETDREMRERGIKFFIDNGICHVMVPRSRVDSGQVNVIAPYSRTNLGPLPISVDTMIHDFSQPDQPPSLGLYRLPCE